VRSQSERNQGALLEHPEREQDRSSATELTWPPLSRLHKAAFGVTAAFYLAVVLAVLTTSRLVGLDWDLMTAKPYERWPQLHGFLNEYVIAGQRGPSAIVAYVWLLWRAWRTRSWRPPLMMTVALLLLNMSVGAVKIGLGRLGPHYAHVMGSAELFQGGDIFPSGHTANAVVTWGVLAYLATRFRRGGAVIAGFMGVTIGLTTVYLGTHWFSDVLAGWAAGALVMLLLPLFEPTVCNLDLRMQSLWRRRAELRAELRARLRHPLGWDPERAFFTEQERAEAAACVARAAAAAGALEEPGDAGAEPAGDSAAAGPVGRRLPSARGGADRPAGDIRGIPAARAGRPAPRRA